MFLLVVGDREDLELLLSDVVKIIVVRYDGSEFQRSIV